jgi:hypothetical protein
LTICVTALGVDRRTGVPVLPQLSLAKHVERLDPSLLERPPAADAELGLVQAPDPYDPLDVGWVLVVGRDDPAAADLVDAVRPLTEARTGRAAAPPIVAAPGDDPVEWIRRSLGVLRPSPKYVLLAGAPRHLPFALQAALAASGRAVGRLDMSTPLGASAERHDLDGLARYVARVVAEPPECSRPDPAVVVWATSAPRPDPTFYSRHLLAAPLAQHVCTYHGCPPREVVDSAATARDLIDAVGESRPVFVFTAGHGAMVEQSEGIEAQEAFNGALVGQDGSELDATLLPADATPFVEGGIVFQFACFGFGTPSTSGYHHLDARIEDYHAPVEVTSALPKRALAHPRGPLAWIGHADWALMHAFVPDPFGARLQPNESNPLLSGFVGLVDECLYLRPAGDVLTPLANELHLLDHQLVTAWNDVHAGTLEEAPLSRLVDLFVRRNDARHHFLFGDPAARPVLAVGGT